MADKKQEVVYYGKLDNLNEDDLITQSEKFQVVFYGELAPGADVETVKKNLAKIFKADKTRIDPLFSGKKQIIKKDAARDVCDKARKIFAAAGAICAVVPQREPVRKADSEASQMESDNGFQSEFADTDIFLALPDPVGVTPTVKTGRGLSPALIALGLITLTAATLLYFLVSGHFHMFSTDSPDSISVEKSIATLSLPAPPETGPTTARTETTPPAAGSDDPGDVSRQDAAPPETAMEEKPDATVRTDTVRTVASTTPVADPARPVVTPEPVLSAEAVPQTVIPEASSPERAESIPQEIVPPVAALPPAEAVSPAEPEIPVKERIGEKMVKPVELVRSPTMPTGSIRGLDFEAAHISLKNGVLHFRHADALAPKREMMIYLFLDDVFLLNPTDVADKTFDISPQTRPADTPHIYLHWEIDGEETPRTDVIVENYNMRLSFETIENDAMAGHIDLTIPGNRKTQVTGPFTVGLRERAGR